MPTLKCDILLDGADFPVVTLIVKRPFKLWPKILGNLDGALEFPYRMVGSSEYPLDFCSHEIEFCCCIHPLQIHVHLVSTLEGGFQSLVVTSTRGPRFRLTQDQYRNLRASPSISSCSDNTLWAHI